MPLIILLAGLLIYGIIAAYESSGSRKEPFSKAELDEISRLIRGKSQAEARRIIKHYRSTTN